jgi:hypothetical protein
VGKEWQGVWFLSMREVKMEDRFWKLSTRKESHTYSRWLVNQVEWQIEDNSNVLIENVFGTLKN